MSDIGDLRSIVESDPSLNDKLKAASTIDDAVGVLRAAGVTISKAELLKAQARRLLDYSDAELETAKVGSSYTTDTISGCVTWVFGCCG